MSIKYILILSLALESIALVLAVKSTMQVNSFILKEYDKVATPRVFQGRHHETLREICEINEILDRLERLEEICED